MIEELLNDILKESQSQKTEYVSEQVFIENILNNIYQLLYKNSQPVHTIGIGILRGNTFDMHYKGRLLQKHVESFGAMSYDTTIAGNACELFKKEGKPYLHLYSKKEINAKFEEASKELKKLGFKEEAEALRKRANVTIDQGIGSFLLMPLSFGKEIIGIFTISSMKEYDPTHMLGEDIEKNLCPVSQMLSIMLYMEKISYDKANDMGRLLISSVDAKDEYQASHSLNVRTMIDFFIDELSRDKELRERVESIGLKLTVERIERLRLAALLHDIGKIFIPGSILRKSDLTKEEILIRKMHTYCTYNILSKSKTLKHIADIASMHHAFYFLPSDTSFLDEYSRIETDVLGYPFDRMSENSFSPETQVIALADVLNAIVRTRPGGKGLELSKALDIIENEEHKFHQGLKDIFVTVVRRVEKNLEEGKYISDLADEYRSCLWLEGLDEQVQEDSTKWTDLKKFLNEIKFNTMGIISVVNTRDINFSMDDINIEEKPSQITKINDEHIIFSIRDIPKEEGFIWINKIYDTFKSHSFDSKISFSFIGKSGCFADLEDIYKSLADGLTTIKNEPVHYFLNPEICCCD